MVQFMFLIYKATASPSGATSRTILSTVVSATPTARNIIIAAVTMKAIVWTLTRVATYTAAIFRSKGKMRVNATQTAGSTHRGVAQIGKASALTMCVKEKQLQSPCLSPS